MADSMKIPDPINASDPPPRPQLQTAREIRGRFLLILAVKRLQERRINPNIHNENLIHSFCRRGSPRLRPCSAGSHQARNFAGKEELRCLVMERGAPTKKTAQTKEKTYNARYFDLSEKRLGKINPARGLAPACLRHPRSPRGGKKHPPSPPRSPILGIPTLGMGRQWKHPEIDFGTRQRIS
jgi:hypothetical protein